MKMKGIAVILIAVAVVAAGIYFFILRSASSDVDSAASLYIPEEPGLAVEAVVADYGNVIPSVKSSGLIRGMNEAVVISETRGVIVEVFKKIGDAVVKGDPILRVDGNTAEYSMIQAEQQLKSAEIDNKAVNRAFEGGNASESELLAVQSRLAGAKAQYEDAAKRFKNSVIKAPIDGFLADIESNLSIGNYISEGIRIGKVIDISKVRVDLFLGDDQVSRIRIGMPALIESAGRLYEGSVAAIALSSDKNTGSFRVIVEAENPYGIEMRSGFAADVSINGLTNEEKILIPTSSVIGIGVEKYVFIIEDNKAVRKMVKTGVVSGNRQEILSGINKGEIVIVSGLKSMSEGASVLPRIIVLGGGK